MHPHSHRGRAHRAHGPFTLPEITVDEDAPVAYRVYHELRRVARAQKQMLFRRLTEKDTHPAQAFSLWVLSENEGMNQADLADTLNVSRPTVTIMLKKMQKAGLIERRPDEKDHRYVRIYLTDSGRALHADLETVHAGIVEATIGSMSEAELVQLERLLKTIEGNLEEAQ